MCLLEKTSDDKTYPIHTLIHQLTLAGRRPSMSDTDKKSDRVHQL